METINLKSRILIKDELSVAFGYFDGLHIAHKELFKQTIELAKKNNTKSAVISFHPNPNYILQKNTEQTSLTPMFDKEKLLSDFGFDYFFIIDFTLELAKLNHRDFIKKTLSHLNIKDIVVGFDNKYGAKGLGNTSTLLEDFENKVNVVVVDELLLDGKKIGTSRIKDELLVGNVNKVTELLGRMYKISGIVVYGRGLGKTINFPTANIALNYQYTLPKNGVYNVYVTVDNIKHLGILNIGNNPTFNYTSEKSIEVNIIDFNESIYNKEISIEFIEFVRDEKKFSSIDELIKELLENKRSIIEKYSK